MEMAELTERFKSQLPGLLGIELVRVEPDEVEARLTVREALCTMGQIMHGGTVMALADTLGAVGTAVNLRSGQGTTTLESKTNFFGGARVGDTVTAISRPLHRGRRTQVWQTQVQNESGKLLAQVTQTQMVLEG